MTVEEEMVEVSGGGGSSAGATSSTTLTLAGPGGKGASFTAQWGKDSKEAKAAEGDSS